MRLWILAALLSIPPAFGQYDVLISGGRVLDGAGNPWFIGDVAIRGDSIVAVGMLGAPQARLKIDARGLAVAPGFIDIHTHARRGIFEVPTAENCLRQGVTTVMEGPDGSSPIPLAPYLARLEKSSISVNFGLLAGQGSIREQVIGLETGRPRRRKSGK